MLEAKGKILSFDQYIANEIEIIIDKLPKVFQGEQHDKPVKVR
jgi:hypothetical protein